MLSLESNRFSLYIVPYFFIIIFYSSDVPNAHTKDSMEGSRPAKAPIPSFISSSEEDCDVEVVNSSAANEDGIGGEEAHTIT